MYQNMKKIGVATFFPNDNYGCLLQAFSLQKCLSELGYDAEVIYFEPNWRFFTSKKNFLHVLYALCRYYRRHFLLKKWIFPGIKCSKSYHSISEIELETYDILIAGSDQIWHPRCFAQQNGGLDFYFLNFCHKTKKRIAYAPSLSVLSWPANFYNQVKPLLKKFNFISVREKSSEIYLKSLGFDRTVCVCDPTILHKASFYEKNFDLKSSNEKKQPFVFLIREVVQADLINDLCNHAKIISMRKMKSVVSVRNWLDYIYNSDFVITDSFHCVVFCLLFHKKFIVLLNESTKYEMNERFVSLIGRAKLAYRCVNSKDLLETIKEKLFKEIDWKIVDSILDEMRDFSLNWLKNALEK